MGVLRWADAVDIGHGRGRLARDAAASLRRVDDAFGRAADINDAWRSPEDADANYAAYLRFLAGGPWAPIALPGNQSVHCMGYALDTDDTADWQMAIWNDHGWFWTVYRNGRLAERWHLEYFASRDNHRNGSAPTTNGQTATNESEEDDMRIIYSKHLDREFLIGDGGITHLVGGASAEYNAIGVPGNRNTNQLGKNGFRMVVEGLGLSYERTRLLKEGERLQKDTRNAIIQDGVAVLDAGNVPWGPNWA